MRPQDHESVKTGTPTKDVSSTGRNNIDSFKCVSI